MRISDWSSDVCSSDLQTVHFSFALPEMPVDAGPDLVGTEAGDEAAGFTADIEPVNYLNLAVRVNGRPLAFGGHGRARSEARRAGEEWVSTGRSQGWASH